jgi:hypothetical protein
LAALDFSAAAGDFNLLGCLGFLLLGLQRNQQEIGQFSTLQHRQGTCSGRELLDSCGHDNFPFGV